MTASDGPDGYRARGAPPAQNDDGTITPTAAGGSFVFTPTESLAALRHMYDTYRTQLWWRYGFKDAYNPVRSWFATDHLGIDQGPIVLMIENHRTGTIWETFMRNEHVQRGLERAGFRPVQVSVEDDEVVEARPGIELYPNPVAHEAQVVLQLQATEDVHLALYNVLGQVVYRERRMLPPGRSVVPVDVSAFAPGVYLLDVTHDDIRYTRPFTIAR